MSKKHQIALNGSWVASALACCFITVYAVGTPPVREQISQGQVTTDDVYVRYGNSLNHYPVCKLKSGDRVTIVGDRGEWYEILPPEGTFSLISAEYVDTVDNVTGVVNGNNVRVRAGSLLKDWKDRREPQSKLSKGAEVTILKVNPDGFLEIVPPVGVTMWVSRRYVEPVPDALAEAEAALIEPADVEQPTGDDNKAEDPAGKRPTSALAALPTSEQRRQLEKLDLDTRTELEKPLLERELQPLLERYQVITKQEEDLFAKRYAQRRVGQVTRMQGMIEAVRRVRALGRQAEVARRNAFEERTRYPEVIPPIPSGVDAQGELRISALYPPGSQLRRYRLVDTTGEKERTVGYVEIPADSGINVDAYLGRYIGVRASHSRLQVGGVNPVPIYVAAELFPLLPASDDAGSPAQDK